MSVGGAAKRYAKAAFDVAKNHGQLDEWEVELTRLNETLQNPQAQEFFEHPSVPPEAKQSALQSLAPGEDERFIRNLLLLLLERGRLQQLPQIVEVFHSLVLQERGIVIADVTTAVELEQGEIERVRVRLQQMVGKTIEVRLHVDPRIVGGIVIHMGDTLIDGSVQTQLRQLRQQMSR